MIDAAGRPGLAHLVRLTDETSIFEHASGALPRREHGYCTDDAGRALLVTCRSDDPSAVVLTETYLTFLGHLHRGEGRFDLRMGFDRRITHRDVSDDACGRALHGLGVAAANAPAAHLRDAARGLFDAGTTFRSPWLRAMAHAGVGAAAVLEVDPSDASARALAVAAASMIAEASHGLDWPESRLAYCNALVPDCLIATGGALGDDGFIDRGLRMLCWLADVETAPAGHLSPTPTGGRGMGETGPAFDQQPLEAATLFEAAVRAHRIAGDPGWLEVADRAAGWFTGHNDLGVVMFDPETEGGYDGLGVHGPNRNQGAESTIAMLSVLHVGVGASAPRVARERVGS